MANIYTSRNSATNPSSDNSAYTLNGFEFQNPYGSTSLSGTGLFGAVTSKDKARYEQSQAEKEWLSQMQLYEYEQWYNSEEQQVARMRAAGLNPDLLGLESASETSAPDSMISGMAAPSGAQDVDTVMSFIHLLHRSLPALALCA